jgi:hypothetical protein
MFSHAKKALEKKGKYSELGIVMRLRSVRNINRSMHVVNEYLRRRNPKINDAQNEKSSEKKKRKKLS